LIGDWQKLSWQGKQAGGRTLERVGGERRDVENETLSGNSYTTVVQKLNYQKKKLEGKLALCTMAMFWWLFRVNNNHITISC
jgi:hypothetical protein